MRILKEVTEKCRFRFDDETEEKLSEIDFKRSVDDSFYYHWIGDIVINLSEDGYTVDFSIWNCKTKKDLTEKYERYMKILGEIEKILGVNEDE